MGITIHFEGRLLNEDSYESVISKIKSFSKKHSWPVKKIPAEVRTLERVKDEEDWDYTGITRGIEIQPHHSTDPLRFEFDKNLYIQEYCKTQFAPISVHVLIIRLIREIQQEFGHLEIIDEGEYWDCEDIDVLTTHITKCNKLLEKKLKVNANAQGPIRLPSGRVVDYMS